MQVTERIALVHKYGKKNHRSPYGEPSKVVETFVLNPGVNGEPPVIAWFT